MSFWTLEHPSESPAIYLAAEQRTLSYGELAEYVSIRARQMPKDQVFALECRNDLNSLLAYLAALQSNSIPLLVSADADPLITGEIYERFQVRSIFDGPAGDWKAKQDSVRPQSALGLLLTTSGSSGSPKLVKLSKSNLQSNARSISSYLELRRDDVAITSLPFNYSYGLSIINSHLLAGSRIVLTDAAVTTATFWNAFKEGGVTSLSGVPTTWRLLSRLRFERMELPTLKTLTQAGGRLDPEEIRALARYCHTTQRRLFVMYGQTEATARISYVPSEQAEAKAGSIGVAIPGGSLSLVDSEGNPIVAAHIEGELVYRGPNVMLGYAENADDLAIDRPISELHTGDLAYRDEDGYFWITGRKSRFIKLFGVRTGLDDVERQLRVMGINALATGEDDCLMIAVLKGSDTNEALAKLSKLLRVHPSAIRIFTVSEFPIAPSGKVLYADLLCQLKEHAEINR
jgi:long-chain acyl-CoA synthetase